MRAKQKIEAIDNKQELAYLREQVEKLSLENQMLVQAKSDAEIFNKRKSEFLANMSHELRTPMHAILSFSKMSLKKMGVIERSKLRKNMEIVYESGQRLLHTLNDILDISKLEAGKTAFNMQSNDLLREIMLIIQELQSLMLDKGIQYEFTHENTDGVAVFDRHKIGQVIQNLLGNAIKFSPIEGTIRIHIEGVEHNALAAIKTSITNFGLDIPEAELTYIFDKYFQSSAHPHKIGGTGLGLPIAKEIITNHNGDIWAECDSQNHFHFILPLKQKTTGEEQCNS